MLRVTVNSAAEVRVLSPFAYRDPIKTLEKSNENRVTLDGVRVFRSAVTKGVDVKLRTGVKYHLYYYLTEADSAIGTAKREFLPITAAEYDSYRAGTTIVLETAKAETETVPPTVSEAPAPEAKPAKRKAKREAVTAE